MARVSHRWQFSHPSTSDLELSSKAMLVKFANFSIVGVLRLKQKATVNGSALRHFLTRSETCRNCDDAQLEGRVRPGGWLEGTGKRGRAVENPLARLAWTDAEGDRPISEAPIELSLGLAGLFLQSLPEGPFVFAIRLGGWRQDGIDLQIGGVIFAHDPGSIDRQQE